MKFIKLCLFIFVSLLTCNAASSNLDNKALKKRETERTYNEMLYKFHRAMEIYKKSDADSELTDMAKTLTMECANNAQILGTGDHNIYPKGYIVQTRYGSFSFPRMKNECESLHQKLVEKKLTGCFKSAVIVLSQNKAGSWGATGFDKEIPGQEKLGRVSGHSDIDLQPIDCAQMPNNISAPSTYEQDMETINRLCGKGYPGYLSKDWVLDDSNPYRLKRFQKMICYIEKI